jgi:hypothetical protein
MCIFPSNVPRLSWGTLHSNLGIGEVPWFNLGVGYKLPKDLVKDLHDNSIFFLKDAAIGDVDSLGRNIWQLAASLELEGHKYFL